MYLHGWRFDSTTSTGAKEYFEKDNKSMEVCYPCNFVSVRLKDGKGIPNRMPLPAFITFVNLFS